MIANVTVNEIFIIEEDYTLVFDCGRELYLSKINIGKGRYLLELADRYRCIGRRRAHCVSVVNGMRDILIQCNKRFQSFDEAVDFWCKALALDKNLEFVFAMRVAKRTFDQSVIGQLITKYNCKVDSQIDETESTENQSMRITLTFPNSKFSVGTFVGHFLKNDFVFVPYSSAV